MYLNVEGRHPAIQDIARYFEFEHLPDPLQFVSHTVAVLAQNMLNVLPDCPMLTRGLDDLLRAKDCFVRAALPPIDG